LSMPNCAMAATHPIMCGHTEPLTTTVAVAETPAEETPQADESDALAAEAEASAEETPREEDRCQCGFDRAACGACGRGWAQQKDAAPAAEEAAHAGAEEAAPAAEQAAPAAEDRARRPVIPFRLILDILSMAPGLAADAGDDVQEAEQVAEQVVEQVAMLIAKQESTLVCHYYGFRGALVDWLLQLVAGGIQRATAYMTLNLVDRYLLLNHYQYNGPNLNLRLVALVAFRIMAKHNETLTRQGLSWLDRLVRDAGFSNKSMLEMEVQILVETRFIIDSASTADFLPFFLEADQTWRNSIVIHLDGVRTVFHGPADGRGELRDDLASNFLDAALLDEGLAVTTPSEVASAAVSLANRLAGYQPEWPDTLARLSTHSRESLKPCVSRLEELAVMAGTGDLVGTTGPLFTFWSTRMFLVHEGRDRRQNGARQ